MLIDSRDSSSYLGFTSAVTVAKNAANIPAAPTTGSATNSPMTINNPLKELFAKTTCVKQIANKYF